MGEMALRTIQVGMGGWGRNWADEVIPLVKTVDVVACVDPDPSALELVKGTAPRFTSLAAALDKVDAEAVLVTAAVAGHVGPVREALQAGKHVLVEKPFAPTIDEATELVNLAAAQQRTLMVSQNYRFYPAPRLVRSLIEQGDFGPLHHIDLEFRQFSQQRQGHRSPHHAYAQPLLDDMSIHHFDLLRFITGSEPTSIICNAWNPAWSWFAGPPAAAALLTFGEVQVSYRGSWISREPATPWAGHWRMAFENGDIAWTSRIDHTPAGDAVTVIRDGQTEELELPTVQWIDRAGTLSEFADAVAEGREPECTGADNIGSLALRTAAIDSANRHRIITM
jgi:predicted dehydrogenase